MEKETKKTILNPKIFFSILKETYIQWVDDKAVKLAGALSFFSLFSLVPLLVITISVVGFFFGSKVATGSIINEVDNIIGREGARVVENLLENAVFAEEGTLATIISVVVLLVGSVIVFVELKESLNIIWGIEIRPGKGLKIFFKNRLFTFPVVLGIGFLLIISLVMSALLSLLNNQFGEMFPILIPVLQVSEILLSVIGLGLMFAFLFQYLPDVFIEWKYVWLGAAFTSILFNLGKFLIGFYIGSTSYGTVYGAAGSLVILLIWIYYSSMIFFFGAEFTQVFRNRFSDKRIQPKKDFVTIKKMTTMLEEKKPEKKL